jgi:hypothetical protein
MRKTVAHSRALHSYLTVLASCVFLFLPSLPAHADALDTILFERAKFFCSWIPAHMPPGNPSPPEQCLSDRTMSEFEIFGEYDRWWDNWPHDDGPKQEFERAWQRAYTERGHKAAVAAAAKREARLAAKVHDMDTMDLCIEYRRSKSKSALDEIARRNSFTMAEWDLVNNRQLQLGMSELALVCSLGQPASTNRSVGSWGVHIQYVYGDTLVYVENGKVTSFQD